MATRPELTQTVELTPAFHDIDAMEVVWHGHYIKYMEIARDALLARCGYDHRAMRDSGYLWPVVELRVKYVRPAQMGRTLQVRADIVEWENRLRVDYTITDLQSGQKLTTAQTTQVAVCRDTGEMQFVCPRVLWDCLGVPS
jgi:acyl-CoA thioester hydrolase